MVVAEETGRGLGRSLYRKSVIGFQRLDQWLDATWVDIIGGKLGFRCVNMHDWVIVGFDERDIGPGWAAPIFITWFLMIDGGGDREWERGRWIWIEESKDREL